MIDRHSVFFKGRLPLLINKDTTANVLREAKKAFVTFRNLSRWVDAIVKELNLDNIRICNILMGPASFVSSVVSERAV